MDGYPDLDALVNQLLAMVNAIITATIVLVAVTVIVYVVLYAARGTRRTQTLPWLSAGFPRRVEIVRKAVASLSVSGGYLLVKTVDGKVYAYRDVTALTVKDYNPYRGMGSALAALAALFLAVKIAASLLGVDTPWLISIALETWPALLAAGLAFWFIKKTSLYVESASGASALFIGVDLDPLAVERVLAELSRAKTEHRAEAGSATAQ